MRNRMQWRLPLAVGCAAALAGCAAAPDQAPATAPKVIEAAGYRLDTSVAAAVSFPLTRTVFTGVVVGSDAAVHATDVLADGATLDVVYTPLRVRVTSVSRGPLRAGQTVMLRIMGGTADGVQYVTEDAPALADLPVGAPLLIWGSSMQRVEVEPTQAVTPYFVYRRSGDQYVDVTYASSPSRRVSAPALHQQVESAARAWRKDHT